MRAIEDRQAAAQALRTVLEKVERFVVLSGAGASAASGVPTYRGAGGSWTRYDPSKYASIDYFRQDPSYYWNFYRDERYPALKAAGPNPVHHALAELERRGKLSAVVTQNIDGLHQAAGSQRVLELHGNSRRFRCQACADCCDFEAARAALEEKLPPGCPACGEPALRPDVVLFGEGLPPDVLRAAAAEMEGTELVMVVGSSLVVQPAASLPLYALEGGAPLVILNLDPTPLDDLASLVVRVPADEVLPLVVESG